MICLFALFFDFPQSRLQVIYLTLEVVQVRISRDVIKDDGGCGALDVFGINVDVIYLFIALAVVAIFVLSKPLVQNLKSL